LAASRLARPPSLVVEICAGLAAPEMGPPFFVSATTRRTTAAPLRRLPCSGRKRQVTQPRLLPRLIMPGFAGSRPCRNRRRGSGRRVVGRSTGRSGW
jgi:hypothetical protein